MKNINSKTFNELFNEMHETRTNKEIIDTSRLEDLIDFNEDLQEQFENLENQDVLSFLNYIDKDQIKRVHACDYNYISEGLLLEILLYKIELNINDNQKLEGEAAYNIIYDFISYLSNSILETLEAM